MLDQTTPVDDLVGFEQFDELAFNKFHD
jgi:hypothetical protein